MEAWRFGFDLPSAYKFDPTDTDIVVHYLLPRALGVHNPYSHAVIDGDPCSSPPWEFMRRNKHGDSDHAFFFGPPRALGKRAARVVSPGEDGDGVGGKWDAQKSTETRIILVRGGDGPGAGAQLPIKYKRCNLSYYHGDEASTSGWVMHEYQITSPPWLSSTLLSRVKVTDRGKQKQRRKDAAAGGGLQQVVVVPGPDQPGPSNYADEFVRGHDHDDDDDGNALRLSGGGEQSEIVYTVGDGNACFMNMLAYDYQDDGYGFTAGDELTRTSYKP